MTASLGLGRAAYPATAVCWAEKRSKIPIKRRARKKSGRVFFKGRAMVSPAFDHRIWGFGSGTVIVGL